MCMCVYIYIYIYIYIYTHTHNKYTRYTHVYYANKNFMETTLEMSYLFMNYIIIYYYNLMQYVNWSFIGNCVEIGKYGQLFLKNK